MVDFNQERMDLNGTARSLGPIADWAGRLIPDISLISEVYKPKHDMVEILKTTLRSITAGC